MTTDSVPFDSWRLSESTGVPGHRLVHPKLGSLLRYKENRSAQPYSAMDFLLKPPSARIHSADDNEFHYTSPPLDGSLTVPELYDFHYAHNPDHPVFRYNDGTGIKQLRFREVVPAAYHAARYIGKAIGVDLDAGQRLPTTVAVLPQSDSITSFTTVVGMLRADITFFMIWFEHSPASIAHLITTTPVSHIFIGKEVGRRGHVEAAIRNLKGPVPIICELPTYDDLYNNPGNSFIPFGCDPRRKDLSTTRFVMHSSGSTSFPKPIPWNDRAYLQTGIVPLFGDYDLLGHVFGCFGTGMYYGGGLNLVTWLAATGLIMAMFPPATIGIPPEADTVWDAFLINRPSFLYQGPKSIEIWAKDPTKVALLKDLKGGLVFAGAPLLKAAGDALAKQGCAIHTLYGSTEVGPYTLMFPENPGMDWEYFQLNPQCRFEFLPLDDGRFELIVVGQATTELTVINYNFEGKVAFRTKDIVEPHPTLPNRWRLLGRLDDEIVLTDGSKTTPGPLEDIICQDRHIRSAVMFGTGKSVNGVLIDLNTEYPFDLRSTEKREAFRDLIWPAIEAANAYASECSQIPRELVAFASPEKPFQHGSKGQLKRSAILKEYAEEIEAMYAAMA